MIIFTWIILIFAHDCTRTVQSFSNCAIFCSNFFNLPPVELENHLQHTVTIILANTLYLFRDLFLYTLRLKENAVDKRHTDGCR